MVVVFPRRWRGSHDFFAPHRNSAPIGALSAAALEFTGTMWTKTFLFALFSLPERMKISYDPEVDALSITFRETPVTTKHLAEGIAARLRQRRQTRRVGNSRCAKAFWRNRNYAPRGIGRHRLVNLVPKLFILHNSSFLLHPSHSGLHRPRANTIKRIVLKYCS